MANKHRGETPVTLDGKTYTMRPTFEALVEFEDRAGVTAYEAMKALTERNAAPAKAVASAFYAGIKAGWDGAGRPPAFAEVGRLIQITGLVNLLAAYANFLGNALASDDELRAAAAAATATDKDGAPAGE